MRFLIIGISIISLLIVSFSCGDSNEIDPRALQVTYLYHNNSGSDLEIRAYNEEDGSLMDTWEILDNQVIEIGPDRGPYRGPFAFASRLSERSDSVVINWLNLNKCLTYKEKDLPDINNGVRSIFQHRFYNGYEGTRDEQGRLKKTVFTLTWVFVPGDLRDAIECKE